MEVMQVVMMMEEEKMMRLMNEGIDMIGDDP